MPWTLKVKIKATWSEQQGDINVSRLGVIGVYTILKFTFPCTRICDLDVWLKFACLVRRCPIFPSYQIWSSKYW
jgi:hypothetical protein